MVAITLEALNYVSTHYASQKAGANCVKFQIFDENNLVNHKLKIYKHVKDKNLKHYTKDPKVKVTVDLVKRLYKYSKK